MLGRGAEAVEVGDRPRRVPRRATELGALRPCHRQQHDLGHVGRDAEDLLHPRLVLEGGGDPRGAQAPRPQRQAEAPRRLDDRVEQAGATVAVVAADDRGDDDGGHLGEVLGQVLRRRHHLLLRVAGAAQPLGGGGHERQRRLPVQLAELVLHGLVAHDHPAAAAEVAAGGRLLGEVDAVEQQLVVDRALEIEPPPHGAGRRQDLVDVAWIDVHQRSFDVGSPVTSQRPVNCAGRRSMNDAMPSWKSSVACTVAAISGIASMAAGSSLVEREAGVGDRVHERRR